MQHPRTRIGHAARIERVVAYMVGRLDAPPTLEQLAAVGHFSPWHFHRIYRGLMGETVADTLRRMRLHRAASELLHGTAPLATVARRCGYTATAAFNRAFAAAHGLPPGEYRRRGGLGNAPPAFKPRQQESNPMSAPYSVTIEQRPAIDVAALAHAGDYEQIATTFEKLAAWAAGRGLPQPRSFGVYYDDPATTEAAALRSDACIQIEPGVEPDGAVRRTQVPGGRYAVLVHTGPYAELPDPYRWLFGEWLPDSGEEAADGPMVEEYLNDWHRLPPSEWRTAVCLPLK
ncbi:hypothetical protein N799_01135 [Lysobacter arseniciresistens ZS79]|uniref:HTH araC/xylS-type domain-containing protein n=1 Tax=Lysobacter arseniciresistens ZS79 TaxID=913325 RepID=A0A0A0F8T1_9GAMM|nr:AraC family transcriptional regulator [Lysobacter arseniciresistens]KGM57797.1 hypothetical protein N799_01135 [Lysobacter arseniciresistens ZS79]